MFRAGVSKIIPSYQQCAARGVLVASQRVAGVPWRAHNIAKAYSNGTYSHLIVEKKGANNQVGLVQLNRPKALNALCDELMKELGEAMESLDNDPYIGAVVLTGSTRAVAAGADIKEMQPKTFKDCYESNFPASWDKISTMKKPIIATSGTAVLDMSGDGNVQIMYNVFGMYMFAMVLTNALIIVMKIMICVLNGTVLMGSGNACITHSVYGK